MRPSRTPTNVSSGSPPVGVRLMFLGYDPCHPLPSARYSLSLYPVSPELYPHDGYVSQILTLAGYFNSWSPVFPRNDYLANAGTSSGPSIPFAGDDQENLEHADLVKEIPAI